MKLIEVMWQLKIEDGYEEELEIILQRLQHFLWYIPGVDGLQVYDFDFTVTDNPENETSRARK